MLEMSVFLPVVVVLVLLLVLGEIFIPNIKCPNCNYVGKAKRFIKGSMLIELTLWLCFIIPGLIYTIWRISSRYYGCPKCTYQYVVRLSNNEIIQMLKS